MQGFPRRPVATAGARRRGWLGWLVPIVATAVLSAVCGISVVSAQATGFTNSDLPMMVGDEVVNTSWSARPSCTVGAVLKPRVAGTRYRAALRWLVLAGHCGRKGNTFSTSQRKTIGKVDWVSSSYDMLTVRVEPRATGWTRNCLPQPSGGCVIVPSATGYTPLALGYVSCGYGERTVSVSSWTTAIDANNDAKACGSTTGRIKYFKVTTMPNPRTDNTIGQISSTRWYDDGTERTAAGDRALPGDSGGPIFIRAPGSGTVKLFGIVVETRTENGTGIHDVVVVPLARYFSGTGNSLGSMLASGNN